MTLAAAFGAARFGRADGGSLGRRAARGLLAAESRARMGVALLAVGLAKRWLRGQVAPCSTTEPRRWRKGQGYMRWAVALISTLLVVDQLEAHEDTQLTIDTDGFVRGFPDDLGPIRVVANFGLEDVCGAEPPTLSIVFGRREVSVPRCLLGESDPDRVYVYGSWYHYSETGDFPPYIVLQVALSQEIMFDMETGDILLDIMDDIEMIRPDTQCLSSSDERVGVEPRDPLSHQCMPAEAP